MPGADKKRKSTSSKSSKGVTKKRKISRKQEFANPNARKPEVKFVDSVADAEPFYNASAIVATPSTVLVGANNYNRVGTKIQLKGLEYQMVIYRTAAGVVNTFPSACRVVFVYDKTPNAGVTVVWTDVMTSQDTAGSSFSNQFFNKPNVSEKDRFLILHDEMFSLPAVDASLATPASAGVWDSAQRMHSKGYIKLTNLISTYNNSSQCTEGAIYVFAINNNSTCTNNATTPYGIQYAFRMSYMDI